MIKHLLAIILFSVLVIMFMLNAHTFLAALLSAHDYIAESLKDIFAGGQTGSIIRELLALLALPFAIALVPALIFYLIRRRAFPYFMDFVWVTWLIQTAALVAQFSITP